MSNQFVRIGNSYFRQADDGQLYAVSDSTTMSALKGGQLPYQAVGGTTGLKFASSADSSQSRGLSFGQQSQSPSPQPEKSSAPTDIASLLKQKLTSALTAYSGVSDTAQLESKRQELLRKQLLAPVYSDPNSESVLSPDQKLSLLRDRGSEYEPMIQSLENQISKAKSGDTSALDEIVKIANAAKAVGITVDGSSPSKDTQVVNVGGRAILIDKNTGQTIKDLGISGDIPAGSTPPSNYNGEFASTIDLISNSFGTNEQRANVKNIMQTAVANKDYPSAYAMVVQATSKALTGTAATNFQQQIQSVGVLDHLKSAIEKYSAAGGDMNILKGTADKIQTKLGVLMTDPKYASLAVELSSAFQQYRVNMTGAAFGAKESAEYASVLPSQGNTLNLNLAKLEGASSYLNSAVESSINSAIGPGGVYIKQYADNASKGQAQEGQIIEKNVNGTIMQFKMNADGTATRIK